MKKNKHAASRRRSLIAAALAVALAMPGVAAAVERCIGAQGEPMFAQNCPRSAPLQRERPASRGVTSSVRAGSLCPRSPQQLEQNLQSALDTRNGVQLSGLALWRGVPARAARAQARELLQLLKAGSTTVALETLQPAYADDAADGEIYDDGYRAAPPNRPRTASLLVMPVTQRANETHSDQLRFAIVRDHGCYWLSPSPQRVVDDSDEAWRLRADAAPLPQEPYVRYGR